MPRAAEEYPRPFEEKDGASKRNIAAIGSQEHDGGTGDSGQEQIAGRPGSWATRQLITISTKEKLAVK